MRKLSINAGWSYDNTDQVIADVKLADDSGVHALFVPETWGQDPFTLLSLLAHNTKHIQLGTAIVNIFGRSAAVLAQHFATLDQLSHGRMILGLGTSGPNVVEHFHGVKFEKPFTRMREYVEVINTLIRGEKLRYSGQVLQLERGFQLQLTPARPHIPIWIASINPKSVRQTAEIADGWLPIFLPKSQWRTQLAVLYDAVDAAGRKRTDVQVRCPYTVTVTDKPERAAERRRALAVRYIARMGDFYYELFVRMGYKAEADAVRAAYAHGGTEAANKALPDALVNELGFAGPVEACEEALDEAREAGFSVLSVSVAEHDPHKRAAIFRRLVG